MPELVESSLGNHWYTGLAKQLSKTSLGNAFIANQILERTLPKVNGSTEMARAFFGNGGMV